MAAHSQVVNPFSTGSGGVTFEQLVGAYYLVALLAEDIPRGLHMGTTASVRFQQRYTGALLDDIAVTSETIDHRRFTLYLQIKHLLTIGDNKLFRDVLSDTWGTFTNAQGGQFVHDADRLGIVLGEYDAALDQHLQPILDWARTSTSADAFFQKLRTPVFSSQEKQHYLFKVFQPLLTQIHPGLTQEDLYHFLRHLTLLHFDIEHSGARDSFYVWNRLLDQCQKRDDAQARNLASRLFEMVAEHARTAGDLDCTALRQRLADFSLHDRASCRRDLHYLRQHTTIVVQNVSSTIGGRVTLPRTELISALYAEIKKPGTRHLVLKDESGYGKSALLKLLMDRLRQENEVIYLAVHRFQGPSIEAFTHMLGIEQSFETLLGAISGNSLPCLLIDGLEKACGDEDRRTVLNDLLHAVHAYNARIQQCGGSDEHCWRVVCTCSAHDWESVLHETALLTAAQQQSLTMFPMKPLTEEELGDVVAEFPRLHSLSSHSSLRTLLLRPFYLDLLTKGENTLEAQDLPEQVTEAWFLNWFWGSVVRDPARSDERENTLLTIARRQLQEHQSWVSTEGLDGAALRTLLSQTIVQREDMEIRFAHDLYADWAKAKLLASQSHRFDIFQQGVKYYPDLLRPLSLRALHFLEVQRNVQAWKDLAEQTSQEGMPPAWRDAVIGALFHSLARDELVLLTAPALFDASSHLLMHLLRIMRMEHTVPQEHMRDLLARIQDPSRQSQYQAWWREPVIPVWHPVVKVITENTQRPPAHALVELAKVCDMWMHTSSAPLRADVGMLCLHMLQFSKQDEQSVQTANVSPLASLSRAERDEMQKHFALALFAGIDCLPDEVMAYIQAHVSEDRQSPVGQLLLEGANWVSVARAQPSFFTDMTIRIVCRSTRSVVQQPTEDDEDAESANIPLRRSLVRGSLLSTGGGTRNDSAWSAGVYDQGPFYYFLRVNRYHGLLLITSIVNHATDWWRLFQERDEQNPRTPLPQTIYWPDGKNTELWGDARVYTWGSTGLCQSRAAVCALRALEKWLYDTLDEGEDISRYLLFTLASSTSLALAHVLINVFLKDPSACWPALTPLLSCPAVWVLEPSRLQTRYLYSGWSFGNPVIEGNTSEARVQELGQLAGMEHFKARLLTKYLDLLVAHTDEARGPLSALLTRLPQHIPVFFHDEMIETALREERRNDLEEISAWADPSTWQVQMMQDADTGKEWNVYTPPQSEKARIRGQEQQKEIASLREVNRVFAVSHWGRVLRDTGEVGGTFTLDEAVVLIEKSEELARIVQEHGAPIYLLDVLAMIVAGLIMHQSSWLLSQQKMRWAVTQLIDVAAVDMQDSLSRHVFTTDPTGASRSLAMAVPKALEAITLLTQPQKTSRTKQHKKKKAVDALLPQLGDLLGQLIGHPQYEVRHYLFRSLRMLWLSQPSFVYECWKTAIQQVLLQRRLDQPVSQESWRQLASIRPEAIDFYALIEVLDLLPRGADFEQCPFRSDMQGFIEQLLLLTETVKEATETDHNFDAVFSFLMKWEQAFGHFLGEFALSLPRPVLDSFLVPVLVQQGQKLGSLLCQALYFLLKTTLEQTDHSLDPAFLAVWRSLALGILNSEDLLHSPAHFFYTDLLAALIFSEPLAFSDLDTRLPLDSLTEMFDLWVARLGHTVSGYKTLIRFLRKNGRTYIADQGVEWLLGSWERLSRKNAILEQSDTVTALSHVLHDMWFRIPARQQKDIHFLGRFARIVNECAVRGSLLAVELQRTMQGI